MNFLGDGFPFLQNWRQELYTPHPSSPPRQNEAKHINKALKEKTERQTRLKTDGQYAVYNSLQTAVRVSRLDQNKFVS